MHSFLCFVFCLNMMHRYWDKMQATVQFLEEAMYEDNAGKVSDVEGIQNRVCGNRNIGEERSPAPKIRTGSQ